MARKLGRFGGDFACNNAAFALHKIAASHVALHLAVDMKVDSRRQIADDFDVGCNDRKCMT